MSVVEEDIALGYLKSRRPSLRPQSTIDTVIESSSTKTNEEDHYSDIAHDSGPQQEFSLPPVDGGLNAYLVLVSGFCIEGVVWGIPFSYSVMQQVTTPSSSSCHSLAFGQVALPTVT